MINPTLAEYIKTAVYYELCVLVDNKFIMVVGKPIEWRLYVESTDHVLVNDATFMGKLEADQVGEHYASFQLGNAQLTLYTSLFDQSTGDSLLQELKE